MYQKHHWSLVNLLSRWTFKLPGGTMLAENSLAMIKVLSGNLNMHKSKKKQAGAQHNPAWTTSSSASPGTRGRREPTLPKFPVYHGLPTWPWPEWESELKPQYREHRGTSLSMENNASTTCLSNKTPKVRLFVANRSVGLVNGRDHIWHQEYWQ